MRSLPSFDRTAPAAFLAIILVAGCGAQGTPDRSSAPTSPAVSVADMTTPPEAPSTALATVVASTTTISPTAAPSSPAASSPAAGPVSTRAAMNTVPTATLSVPSPTKPGAAGAATVATTTVPAPMNHFSLLGVGVALPTDATCASKVRPVREIRAANAAANATRGQGGNTEFPRVSGNYAGTTDDILQWTACKWGIDEDVVRSQAALESYWMQSQFGDFNTDSSTCAPGHRTLGTDGQAGQCPQSIGILQDRYPYHMSAFATNDNATVSTAYNADYAYAVWRNCFEGNDGWFDQFGPPTPYRAGDMWGCIGSWYSGRWYDSGAKMYIAKVQSYLAQRIWTTDSFINYS